MMYYYLNVHFQGQRVKDRTNFYLCKVVTNPFKCQREGVNVLA